jgi:hypothetical protein
MRGLYRNITEITKTTSVIAEGSATGSFDCDALTIPLSTGESIVINAINGETVQLTLSADAAIGDRTIYFETSVGGSSIEFKSPISVGASVTLMTTDIAKQGRRKNQMYISFSSQFGASQYWTTFSSSGISNHSWNYVTTSTGKTVGTSTITVPTAQQAMGIIIPFDCTLIGFSAICYRVGDFQSAVGLFCGTPLYNDFGTQNFTLRAYAAADNSAGPDSNYSQRPVKAEDLSRSFELSAGDIILPAFNSVTNDTGNLRVSYQIVLEYPLL